jgi:nucleotide-binding universal stress UspA family protein
MAIVDDSALLTRSPLDTRPGFLPQYRPLPGETATGAGNPRRVAGQLHIRRILVCLDRSTFSEACVPQAVSLAKTFGSDITLVHILRPLNEHPGHPTNDALDWELARQEAQGYLERIQRETSTALGAKVDVRLEQGRPAQRLADVARELAVDLTVLGTRGEGGAPPLSLGSVVQQVLAEARGSVFIAQAPPRSPPLATSGRILVALDGSLRTESVLPAAARIATARGAELLLVHVVQEPLPTALLDVAEDMKLARELAARLEAGAARYLDHLKRQLAHEVPSVRTLVARHANQHQCLLEISQKERADLIVLSAHGATCDSRRSFGSITAYLLTHSAVPLLVLQDLPESDPDQAEELDAKSSSSPPLRASYAPESA